MQYKLLALDLDGTVLSGDHTISPALIKTIKRVSQQYHVLIVTGRHHVAAKPYYDQLELDTPIICCNGTYTYDYKSDTVLNHNAIPKPIAHRFLQQAEHANLKMVMYVRDAMLYSNKQPINYIEALSDWADSFPVQSRPRINKVDDFAQEIESNELVWKFVVEGNQIDEFANSELVKKHFNGERSWSDRIDFAAKGNSKGAALTNYLKPLGITLAECVAIGDNHNDISMLKLAGLGVAMKNADETVKQFANMVTEHDHNDSQVLAELLKKLFI